MESLNGMRPMYFSLCLTQLTKETETKDNSAGGAGCIVLVAHCHRMNSERYVNFLRECDRKVAWYL